MAEPLLPTHASSQLLHLPPQVLKRKHTKAVHSNIPASLPCLLPSLYVFCTSCHPWSTVVPFCLSNLLPNTKLKARFPRSLLCQWFLQIYLQTWPVSNFIPTPCTVCWALATQMSTSTCALAKGVSYISCTPCHIPTTSMVFLKLYPSLPTEMLTSLQSWTQMIPPPQSFPIILFSIILLNSFCVRTYPRKYNHPILLCLIFFQAFLLSPTWPQRTHRV